MKLEKLREIANTIPRAKSMMLTGDSTEFINRLSLYIDGANTLIEHIDALLDVVEAAIAYQHVHHRDDVDVCKTCVALARLEAVK